MHLTYKTYYIGSSQWYYETRPFQFGRNIAQSVGLALGGIRVLEPWIRGNLPIDQAQTIAAVRGINFTITTYGTGISAAKGAAFGAYIGSIVPGIGTTVGGIVGSISGVVITNPQTHKPRQFLIQSGQCPCLKIDSVPFKR